MIGKCPITAFCPLLALIPVMKRDFDLKVIVGSRLVTILWKWMSRAVRNTNRSTKSFTTNYKMDINNSNYFQVANSHDFSHEIHMLAFLFMGGLHSTM